MKEQVRSKWFPRKKPPRRAGVYLTRASYGASENLTWWRAFDGENWHAGFMAVSAQGEVKSTAPTFEDAVVGTVIGEHVLIEWCGVIE